jgi:hypothetical protein
MVQLPTCSYDDSVLMSVTESDNLSQQYAVSSLGLWSLKTAFEEGSYQIRTSDMARVMKEQE